MTLKTYQKKRDFGRTPEPKGRQRHQKKKQAQALSFVVQKHSARRLHYDFRLEIDGVLKSWSIPKGPSLNPHDKRLAVETEDHPLEYGAFEGVIPKGQYGGGTVLIWDRGKWLPKNDFQEGYKKGNLNFTLKGAKLHGDWSLIRMHTHAEKDRNWLLIKSDDAAASPEGN